MALPNNPQLFYSFSIVYTNILNKNSELTIILEYKHLIFQIVNMRKQQKENQEIARIIEREQIISYKRKPTTKISKDSDDEIESAHSLKSGVYSDDSVNITNTQVRFNKKNTPLPQLNREKKKIFARNIGPGNSQQVNNYLEKEVRQHDNLVLKQKNNHLTSENMKLKTRVMALEKQTVRLNKILEDEGTKLKQPGLMPKDSKLKGSQSVSLKMTIKNLRKQLDEQKKQNQKIKWSIKFTRISELQCQRDEIINQTARLRQLLEDQQFKKLTSKQKQQGISHLQQKIHILGDRNLALMRQNSELQNKLKKIDDSSKKFKQTSENQKNLNKMLFNARRVIKQKEKQIQTLKEISGTEGKIQSLNSIGVADVKSAKQMGDRQAFGSRNKNKDKRTMSKSAQKYRKNGTDQSGNCENCNKLKQQIHVFEKKIEDLTLELKKQRENFMNKGLGDFRRQQIQPATEKDVEEISKFLTFRFKAHHLSLEEAERYLINSEINQGTLLEEVSVTDIAESLVAQPFSIISSHYLEVCLMKLFYQVECSKGQKIKIEEEKKIKKGEILENFRKIISPFEIMPQEKQEEMFIQIAQLVTNYHQHILTALNRKKNGEGTITEQQLCSFFNEIQLQKQFVDFIICQIILESIDLEHLNYYTMFQIFYMPNQGNGDQLVKSAPDQPNKKKFQVDHSQIVKEEDQEYEESRSYVEGRQKTNSRRDDDELDLDDQVPKKEKQNKLNESINKQEYEADQMQEYEHQNNASDLHQRKKSKADQIKSQNNEQDYEQCFEQEKMDKLPQQEKANEEEIDQQQMKPYMMEEVFEEYQEQQKK